MLLTDRCTHCQHREFRGLAGWGLTCLGGYDLKLWESVVEREWVGESILGENPSLRAEGKLREECPEPGCLESPEHMVEGGMGAWYPWNVSVL